MSIFFAFISCLKDYESLLDASTSRSYDSLAELVYEPGIILLFM